MPRGSVWQVCSLKQTLTSLLFGLTPNSPLGKMKLVPPRHSAWGSNLAVPKWRNWQTRCVQVAVGFTPVGVRVPSSAPSFLFYERRTRGQECPRHQSKRERCSAQRPVLPAAGRPWRRWERSRRSPDIIVPQNWGLQPCRAFQPCQAGQSLPPIFKFGRRCSCSAQRPVLPAHRSLPAAGRP